MATLMEKLRGHDPLAFEACAWQVALLIEDQQRHQSLASFAQGIAIRIRRAPKSMTSAASSSTVTTRPRPYLSCVTWSCTANSSAGGAGGAGPKGLVGRRRRVAAREGSITTSMRPARAVRRRQGQLGGEIIKPLLVMTYPVPDDPLCLQRPRAGCSGPPCSRRPRPVTVILAVGQQRARLAVRLLEGTMTQPARPDPARTRSRNDHVRPGPARSGARGQARFSVGTLTLHVGART
jgi:hypothetical protein